MKNLILICFISFNVLYANAQNKEILKAYKGKGKVYVLFLDQNQKEVNRGFFAYNSEIYFFNDNTITTFLETSKGSSMWGYNILSYKDDKSIKIIDTSNEIYYAYDFVSESGKYILKRERLQNEYILIIEFNDLSKL